MENNELVYIDLNTEDGENVRCLVITTYTAGDTEYIALAPVDENDDVQDEIFIYGYLENDDGYELLALDDDEFDIATKTLEAILDE